MVARRVCSTAPHLPGTLLAVLLLLFGGSAALAQEPPPDDGQAHGPSAGTTYHPGPPQQLNGAIAHPVHAATHAPLPLLPAAGHEAREPEAISALPERPQLSAAHLTHRSPLHGRAPPPVAGI